ncbi:DUF1636 family protein [Nitratireductor mangrovi]|uniref:DUF1636 family protein n=1 Tax=Nitratireductor mangrovi TaxID=2599600 RepID=A0A5B8L1T3_9HYPH|nr:DUF1636 family protein [Nitratireductor mangrovi]
MTFDDRTGGPAPHDSDPPPSDLAVTILVCSSCRDETGSDARPRPGAHLAAAARAANDHDDVRVVEIECLGNCKRRLSAALLRDDAWSYVFGDLAVENGPDLLVGAKLLQTSEDGLLPWRGRPDCLKRGLVSRIPPAMTIANAANGKAAE